MNIEKRESLEAINIIHLSEQELQQGYIKHNDKKRYIWRSDQKIAKLYSKIKDFINSAADGAKVKEHFTIVDQLGYNKYDYTDKK